MSFQEQPFDYPAHRPALQHRITPRQQKEMTESQVIVPSMSALVPPTTSPFGGYYHAAAAAAAAAYYQLPPYLALPSQPSHRPVVFSTPIHPHQQHHHQQQQQQQHPAVAVHPPIHHTLENATITYDTVAEHTLQKDLVKDVFFSPAMARDSVESTSSGSSISSQSDSESDTSSRPDDDLQQNSFYSPHVTPSDLLQDDDPLFFIGLDFAEDETKKSALCLRQLSGKATTLADLPTPPATYDFAEGYVLQKDSLKRQRFSHLRFDANKKLKVMPSDKITPPTSPTVDYFDDASAEESSDEEDEDDNSQHDISEEVDPVFYNSYHHQSGFQSISAPDDRSDDNESTSSWEDIQQRADMFDDGFDTDSTSDEEEEVVLPKRHQRVTQNEKQHKQKEQVVVAQTQLAPQQPEPLDDEGLERIAPRHTAHPTIYQKLTKSNVDWCRYCGTTEGVNWRPGPWGKRTLCNKHGCDYKGYGFACKLPRLDLTGFAHEAINDRDRPVLQLFCSVCHRQESWQGNVLVRCEGCPKAMHQKCSQGQLTDEFVSSEEQWFCDAACHENSRRKRIVVELPRKRLPLMCAPKNNTTSSSSASSSLRSNIYSSNCNSSS